MKREPPSWRHHSGVKLLPFPTYFRGDRVRKHLVPVRLSTIVTNQPTIVPPSKNQTRPKAKRHIQDAWTIVGRQQKRRQQYGTDERDNGKPAADFAAGQSLLTASTCPKWHFHTSWLIQINKLHVFLVHERNVYRILGLVQRAHVGYGTCFHVQNIGRQFGPVVHRIPT